jgi:hypothetical protein
MASSSIPSAVGVKGSDVYGTTGSQILDLSVLLVRGFDTLTMTSRLSEMLSHASEQDEDDIFVLAFQTRDIRGGKGERELFNIFFCYLVKERPHLAIPLLDLIPEFGCWRDLFQILEISLDAQAPKGFSDFILEVMKAQFAKDTLALAEGKPVSLLAKWAPRESGADSKLAGILARRIFPDESKVSKRMAAYRKLVSSLNKSLNTVEIKMCDGSWDKIEPGKVPGLALAKHMKAFLNEKVVNPPHGSSMGGLRHPDDLARMACRAHFQEHLSKAAQGKAKINGAAVRYPHEVIKKVMKFSSPDDCCRGHCYCDAYDCVDCEDEDEYRPARARPSSDAERDALIAVWNDMVTMARASGGLKRTLAMCDFSGSMQAGLNGDTPYWVSMAMGLLIAEAGDEKFKDTFLTFESTPKFHTLPEGDIFKRVKSIGYIGQGMSTDLQKAMDLVLAKLVETRCPAGEEPRDLIIITDMNFDKACASHEQSLYTGNRYRRMVKTVQKQTHAQMAREAFKRVSEDVFGAGVQGWEPPRIVIWNVAAGAQDFQAQAEEEGVIHLSGWSPSLFKVLVDEGAKVMTPMDALRSMLDADRYAVVRAKLAEARAAAVI